MTTGNVTLVDHDLSEPIILSVEKKGEISGRKACWVRVTSVTGGAIGMIAGTVLPYFSVSLLNNGYHDPVTLCAAAGLGACIGIFVGAAIGAFAGLGCLKCKDSVEFHSEKKLLINI